MFSSKQLDLGLKQEVIDIEGNIGNGEDEDLDSEQEDLLRDELYGLQYGGRQGEQSEDCLFKFIGLIY
jgi:hypothetical protein